MINTIVIFYEKVPLCIYPPALRPKSNMPGPYRLIEQSAVIKKVHSISNADLEIVFTPLPGRDKTMTVLRQNVERGTGPNQWAENE